MIYIASFIVPAVGQLRERVRKSGRELRVGDGDLHLRVHEFEVDVLVGPPARRGARVVDKQLHQSGDHLR